MGGVRCSVNAAECAARARATEAAVALWFWSTAFSHLTRPRPIAADTQGVAAPSAPPTTRADRWRHGITAAAFLAFSCVATAAWAWPLSNWNDCAVFESWGDVRGTILCALIGSLVAGMSWAMTIASARAAVGRPWLRRRGWIAGPAVFLLAAAFGAALAELQRPSYYLASPSACDVYE